METKFLLVNNLSEMLNLNVYDFNDHRKNTLLGTASFELAKLQDDATQEGIHSPILKDGKDRGELRYDISYYPVLKPEEGAELPDTCKLIPFPSPYHDIDLFCNSRRNCSFDSPPSERSGFDQIDVWRP